MEDIRCELYFLLSVKHAIIFEHTCFVACGCSALAVLPSCDQLTGTCDCLEGAIGDKCDDCAFGFTGKV